MVGSNRVCCVPGCPSSEKKNPELVFYVFPGRGWEVERREKWIAAVRRALIDDVPWVPSTSTRICSLHFVGGIKSNDPRKDSYNPTIFPWKPENPLALKRSGRVARREEIKKGMEQDIPKDPLTSLDQAEMETFTKEENFDDRIAATFNEDSSYNVYVKNEVEDTPSIPLLLADDVKTEILEVEEEMKTEVVGDFNIFETEDEDVTSLLERVERESIKSEHTLLEDMQSELAMESTDMGIPLEDHNLDSEARSPIHDDQKNDKLLTCSHCEFQTPYRYNLTAHGRRHKNQKGGVLKCGECEYKTRLRSQLELHALSHKPDEMKSKPEPGILKRKKPQEEAIAKTATSSPVVSSSLASKQLKADVNTNQVLKKNHPTSMSLPYFNEYLFNRRFMELLIRTCVFLAKQDLAFCTPDNSGNFKELLESLVAVSDEEIREHYKKIAPKFGDYSKMIQNDLINCISRYMDEHIQRELNECVGFSILLNDISDISQKSECSVIIRYVITGGFVRERFLGFYGVSSNRNTDILFEHVSSCIKKFHYKSKLVAQCYDGAEYLNQLRAKIKQTAPQAFMVHASCLSSTLKQNCNSILRCRIFFATLDGLPSFIDHCTKRTHLVDGPLAFIARCAAKSTILGVVNNERDALMQVFNEVLNDPSSDSSSIRQSRGFLKEFEDFEFSLLTTIFSDIFDRTEVIDNALKNMSFDINTCIAQISDTREVLARTRNEDDFRKLFESARCRTPLPAGGFPAVNLESGEVFNEYRDLFYEILDIVLGQIDALLNDVNKLEFVTLIDPSKFAKFSENFPVSALKSLRDHYPYVFPDIRLIRLKSELQLIYLNEKYLATFAPHLIKILTADRDVFKETYKLICLILTVFSTSASVERSTSCLKRIKTYVRTTISEQRVSNLAKISIEKEFLDVLMRTQPFYDDISDKFFDLRHRGS